jgi:hypothetical protein
VPEGYQKMEDLQLVEQLAAKIDARLPKGSSNFDFEVIKGMRDFQVACGIAGIKPFWVYWYGQPKGTLKNSIHILGAFKSGNEYFTDGIPIPNLYTFPKFLTFSDNAKYTYIFHENSFSGFLPTYFINE